MEWGGERTRAQVLGRSMTFVHPLQRTLLKVGRYITPLEGYVRIPCMYCTLRFPYVQNLLLSTFHTSMVSLRSLQSEEGYNCVVILGAAGEMWISVSFYRVETIGPSFLLSSWVVTHISAFFICHSLKSFEVFIKQEIYYLKGLWPLSKFEFNIAVRIVRLFIVSSNLARI